MGKKKYTPEEDALILSLKERGVKYRNIAKQVGRTESAVWQRIAALKANKKPVVCGTLGEDGSTCAKTTITADGKSEGLRVVGKCAVRDSYYIPVEELKKLPKDEQTQ